MPDPEFLDPAFRLSWHRSWPDRKDDFEARVGAEFCRIQFLEDGRWFWTTVRALTLASGYAGTAVAAALRAEAAFFGSE